MIAHYRILKLLGEGGMGEVYLAEDQRLGRKVALKVLNASLTTNQDRVRRFEQEARAASALSHPNIIAIFDIGREESIHFIATEFIDGQTLRSALARSRMKLGEALDVALQVASALAAAHAAGIIHRDIKPENIMVRPDSFIKVLDFGLAKLTETQTPSADSEARTLDRVDTDPGTVMGTAGYMSPEQARGQSVDARSDIFSLGIVIYEMIAGRPPFEGVNAIDVMGTILHREPAPLAQHRAEVPAELTRVVNKALRKDPAERYQRIEDLVRDLRHLHRELEFEERLKGSRLPQPTGGEQTSAAGPKRTASAVNGSGATRTTSSAEYLITQLTKHRRVAAFMLAAIIPAAAAWFHYSASGPVLTERDTLLLADFVNNTGEEIFDDALKQALAVQLEQSPFLKIFSTERVRETLKLMNFSPEERVTRTMAREICQRQGLKAVIIGSIAKFERSYAVSLEALEGLRGETIARTLTEAEGKDQVLRALGQGATQLRTKLGESLASVQKFDTPLEQATTSSLEALKAYSLGVDQRQRGNRENRVTAIAPLQRAVELDPQFALAHSALAMIYGQGPAGQQRLAAEHAERAYELRERTSERERLMIATVYHGQVTGDWQKRFEVLKLWTQTYPRDSRPHSVLASQYNDLGQLSQAEAESREAIRLEPDAAPYYLNLAMSLIRRNRFDEAKGVFLDALSRRLDTVGYHARLYQIAFVQGDRDLMQEQMEAMAGKPDEYQALRWQAQTAAFAGKMHASADLSHRARQLAVERKLLEAANLEASESALQHALVGAIGKAKEDLAQAAAPSPGDSILLDGRSILVNLMGLVLTREIGRAQQLIEELARRYPNHTRLQSILLPASRAAIELQRDQPEKALEMLQPVAQYEAGALFWPNYLRGQAYLRLGRGAEAMTEFQKIIEHQGWDTASVVWPLAHLGLGRAAAMAGDRPGSRKAYQDFLELWKEADADVPILIVAQREYNKLG